MKEKQNIVTPGGNDKGRYIVPTQHEAKMRREIVHAMNAIVVNAETGVRINGVHCSKIVDAIVRGDIPHLKIEY